MTEDDDDDLLAEDSALDTRLSDDDGPFSEPNDIKRRLPPDHPQTDANIDAHELYDEGMDGATDVDLPQEVY